MVAWNSVSTNRDYIQDLYGWDITQIKYKVRNEGIDFNQHVSSVQLLTRVWLFVTPWTRFPCPSPTPRAYSNSCLLSQWCHSTISSSVVPFSSCPQSFPASGSFKMGQLFASGGQSIWVSASTSVFQMNTQGWSPLDGPVGSPCGPRDSQESSPTPQFKSINSLVLSFLYSPTHIYTWLLECYCT